MIIILKHMIFRLININAIKQFKQLIVQPTNYFQYQFKRNFIIEFQEHLLPGQFTYMIDRNHSLESQDSQFNSSTSSHQELRPKDQIIHQLRKDNPIIMKSIPQKLYRKITLSHQQKLVISQANPCQLKFEKQLQFTQHFLNQHHYLEHFFAQSVQKQSENYSQIEKQQYIQNLPNQSNSHQQKPKQKQKNDPKNNLNYDKDNLNYDKDNILTNNQTELKITQNLINKEVTQSNSIHVLVLHNNQLLHNNQQLHNQQDSKFKIQKKKEEKQNDLNKEIKILTEMEDKNIIKRENETFKNKIEWLQIKLKNQLQESIIQKKANQVYTDFYQNLLKIISDFLATNLKQYQKSVQYSEYLEKDENLNMENLLKIIKKLTINFKKENRNINNSKFVKQEPKQFKETFVQTQNIQTVNQIIATNTEDKNIDFNSFSYSIDQQNSRLRKQLVQSVQNNINSIFNTQISASCCLQDQVSKINKQMKLIRQRMNLIQLKTEQSKQQQQTRPHSYVQPQMIFIPQFNNSGPQKKQQVKKIVKIYTTKHRTGSSSQNSESFSQQKRRMKENSQTNRKRSKNKNKRSLSSSSEISTRSTKKREQVYRIEIQKLKESYKQTKQQLNKLVQTFYEINNHQKDLKSYFQLIKNQIIKKFSQEKDKENSKKHSDYQQLLQQIRFSKQQKQYVNEKILQKQKSYISQIQHIKKQRSQDKRSLQNLNNKMSDLFDSLHVPQKLTQQMTSNRNIYYDDGQIGLSQISVSVDYIRQIEKLQSMKESYQNELKQIHQQNIAMKTQIIQLKAANNRAIKGSQQFSNNSQKQNKQSFIQQLKTLTEPNIVVTIPSNNISLQQIHQRSLLNQTNNASFNDKPNPNLAMSHITANIQRNAQKNLKVILISKQSHIRHLQQSILNLQQTNQYLRQQILSRERTIYELEEYFISLENQSLNSRSLSPAQSEIVSSIQVNPHSNPIPQTVSQKYQNYVNNLKILLKQTKRQNKILKERLNCPINKENQERNIQRQADQVTQTDYGMKNSAIHSQKTTKHIRSQSSGWYVPSKDNLEIDVRKKSNNDRLVSETQDKFQNQQLGIIHGQLGSKIKRLDSV